MVECSESAVLDWLVKAVSQEPEEAKTASEQLSILGTRLPYFRILAQLFPLPDVPYGARLLCLMQLKHFVQSRWLSGRVADDSVPLTGEERAWFRQQFLANIRLTHSHLQQQLAVIIAKMARCDWPDHWPDLLPTLMRELEHFGTQNEVSEACGAPLIVLVQVVKSFASRRLPSHRRLFLEFASQITPMLLRSCTADMNTLQAGIESGTTTDGPKLLLVVERIRNFLNIFRCLVEFGFRDSQPCPEFDTLIRLVEDFVNYILEKEERLAALDVGIYLVAQCERVLVKATRLLLACQEHLPRTIIKHIPASVEGLVLRWTALAPVPLSALLSEPVVRNLLNLLHVFLTCPRYRPRICRGEAEVAAATAARDSLREVLQPRLDALIRHLVLRHLVLSAADEAELVHDFEAHVFPEETDQEWRYGLQCCVQCLLLLLCTEFDQDGPRLVLRLIQECLEAPAEGGAAPVDVEAGRRREACLGVLGIVMAWVQQDVQLDRICSLLLFPALYQAPLDPRLVSEEARLHDLVYRRRVIWVLGEVADENMSREHMVCLFECLWEYLSPQHETCLRLQSARTLSKVLSVLDDCDDGAAVFDSVVLKGLPVAFEGVHQLMAQAVRECSTKIKLVQVLKMCVCNMQYSPARLAALRSFLPGLPLFWEAAPESQPLLRVALIGLYSEVVATLGSESIHLHDLVCDLVALAVPEDVDADDTLLEAGIGLWHAFLNNARLLELPDSAKERLVALFPRLIPYLERCNDVTLVCLNIAEAYVVVAGPAFMKVYALPLSETLRSIVQLAEPNLADTALLVVESIVKMYPPESLQLFASLLGHLLALLMEFGQTSAEEATELRANHVRILARFFLVDAHQFHAVVLANVGADQLEAAVRYLMVRVKFLLVQWSSSRVRKLMCMTLAGLVGAFGPSVAYVAQNFDAIVDSLLCAVNDLEPAAGDRAASSGLVTDACCSSDNACALPQAKRAMFRDDPVGTCGLRRLVGDCLNKYRALANQEAFEQQMDGLDPVTRQQLVLIMA